MKIVTPGYPPKVRDLAMQDHDIILQAGHENDWHDLIGVPQDKIRVELEGVYKQEENVDYSIDYVLHKVKFLTGTEGQKFSLMYMSII